MAHSVQVELKERVAKGLNFGIEAVEEVLDASSPLYNEFILLKSKYNDLMYVSSLNTLPYDQLELGLNRMRGNLMHIIEQLDGDSLKKDEVAADIKVQALPNRRTNFFQLLHLHHQNLEDITFAEIHSDKTVTWNGRGAIYEIFYSCKRAFKRNNRDSTFEDWKAVKAFFNEYFTNEDGCWEVYFKNVKHMMRYVLESQVEQAFFLGTLNAVFSKYELAMLYYYAHSGLDPELPELIQQCKLFPAEAREILMHPSHHLIP